MLLYYCVLVFCALELSRRFLFSFVFCVLCPRISRRFGLWIRICSGRNTWEIGFVQAEIPGSDLFRPSPGSDLFRLSPGKSDLFRPKYLTFYFG